MSCRSPLCLQHFLLALLGLFLSLTSGSQAAGLSVTTPWEFYPTHPVGEPYAQALGWNPPDTEIGEDAPVFSCTGLPPGLTLNKDTGEISGTPTKVGLYSVSTRVTLGRLSSPVVTRRFAIIPPHLPSPGIHEGVGQIEGDHPLGAFMSVTLQVTGAYSGYLQIGGRRIPLGGFLRQVGTTQNSVSAFFRIPWGPQGSLVKAALYADASNFTLGLADAQGQMQGGVGALILVRPAAGFRPSCPHAGRHMVGLAVDPSASGRRFGNGFGNSTIGADYRQIFVGQTPEGRGITAASWAWLQDDQNHVQYFLYASDGSNSLVLGEPYVPAGPNDGSGNGIWTRLAQPGRFNPEMIYEYNVRFPTSRCSAARMAQAFPAGEGLELELRDEGQWNTRTSFRFSSRYTPVFGELEPELLKLSMDVYLPTGILTGKFTRRDASPLNSTLNIDRTVPFRGLFLPDHDLALGYFLIPHLPDPNTAPPTTLATSPITSGRLLIRPVGKK